MPLEHYITETEVQLGRARGGWVENVIVVTTGTAARRPDFVPYFEFTWRRGMVAISRRFGGAHAWRSLDRLYRVVRYDFGYNGRIAVFEVGDTGLGSFEPFGLGRPTPLRAGEHRGEGEPAES